MNVQSIRDARLAGLSKVGNATWRETQAIRQTANANSQQLRTIGQVLDALGERLDAIQAVMEQDKEQAKRLVPKALGEIVQNALYEIVAEKKYREGKFPLKTINCPREEIPQLTPKR